MSDENLHAALLDFVVRMQVQAFTRRLEAVKLPPVADASIRSGLRADLQGLCRAARALSERLA